MRIENIAIVGYNKNVDGLLRLLKDNSKVITDKTGILLNIKAIYEENSQIINKDIIKEETIITQSLDKILCDNEIHILVESIDDIKKSRETTIKAINKGKNIVLSNKGLLAQYGEEIFTLAKEKNIHLCYESCVGGGIPIIDVVKEDLLANNIKEIYAILNGPSNYILTQLENKSASLDELIMEVKDKGYTETDPSLDISGIDSAYKIAILSMIAFKTIIPFNKIYVEGIQNISKIDLNFAEQLNCKIKLLSIAKKYNDKIDVRVHPTMLPKKYMLSKVRDEFNAIYLKSDMVGSTIHYGRGAGAYAIGSAIASDIMSIARELFACSEKRTPPFGFYGEYHQEYPIIDIDDISSFFYLRFTVFDKPGVLSKIAGVLGKYDISINAAIQPEIVSDDNYVPLVFTTHETKGKNVKSALEEIELLGLTKNKVMVVRVEK